MDDRSALSLYRWLSEDPDVRRDAVVSFGDGQSGEMGGALDVINVVISNSIAFSSLVVAIAAWYGSRKKTGGVEIEHKHVRVTITDDSPETIQRVVAALSAQDS